MRHSSGVAGRSKRTEAEGLVWAVNQIRRPGGGENRKRVKVRNREWNRVAEGAENTEKPG